MEHQKNNDPKKLEQLFTERIFSYANVPYRIRSFEEIIENPKETIAFDFENTKVYVNLDFALKHDGKIYIYDWKTGQKVQEDERQLSVYAMYANQRWDKNYDLIRIFDVYIYSNLPVKVKLNIKSIHDTKKYLRKSIKEMKSSLVDDEKNIASIDNFPMIENINICNRCQYKSLCYPENWKNLK